MDINVIMQAVSSVGFPIAMCLLLYVRLQKSDEQHRDEMDKMRESFDGNTRAITALTVEIEKLGSRQGGQ